MAARFYVYEIMQDGVVVYVGKGSGRRLKQQMIRFACDGRVVRWFKSEAEAYKHETKLIKELRPELNRTGGGGGPKTQRQVVRREVWEIECERFGTQVYAARVLMRMDLSRFLDAATIGRIAAVATRAPNI